MRSSAAGGGRHLTDLTRAVGDEAAALGRALRSATALPVLRARRGASQTPRAHWFAVAAQNRGALAQKLAFCVRVCGAWMSALEAVLAGSRNPHLADDANIDYRAAGEIVGPDRVAIVV